MSKLFKIKQVIAIFAISISSALLACAHSEENPVTIKILGINDFHGQISTGKKIDNKPAGGAAVLAAYLKQGNEKLANNTILAFSGDLVGASPPASGLLNHEPTIVFFNSLANEYCEKQNLLNKQCNLVATIGNHEFDRGKQALLDLIQGTDNPPTKNWMSANTYTGASFPFVSANILDATTGKPIFTPYVIKEINHIKIAFIGAILKDAADVMLPTNITGIKFVDEADAINSYMPAIKAANVDAVVVLIHQGGEQNPYVGQTHHDAKVTGPILSVIERLDDSVDVVMGGHYHLFLNAYVSNAHGKQILLTEANSYSTSFAEVTLHFDAKQHQLIDKSARIIKTYADESYGLSPDQSAARLVSLAEDAIEEDVSKVLGTLKNDLHKNPNGAGESNLGNLITDGYRVALKSDFGIINSGSMRADIFAGNVTWGQAYAVQPFGNMAGTLLLKGQDIYDLFEQQWNPVKSNMLQVSGLTYRYDSKRPIGSRVVAIYQENNLLQKDKTYSIATNEFLAGGGDGFTVLKKFNFTPSKLTDLDVMVSYIKSLPKPFSYQTEGRIKNVSVNQL